MTTTLPLTAILVEDRLRKDYGDIELFAADIDQNGLIQPIVLTSLKEPIDGHTHKLVAGGRRFAALNFLSVKEVTHGVTCDPDHPGFVFANELPPRVQRELELAENLQRLDMSWQENVRGVCEIHTLYKENAALIGVKWTRADTGDRLGGYSNSYVDFCFDVLPEIDTDAFKHISSFTDAIKLKAKMREDAAVQEKLRRTQAAAKETAKNLISTPMACVACESTGISSNGSECPICRGAKIVEQYNLSSLLAGDDETEQPTTIVDLTHTIINMNCIKVMQDMSPDRVDHIITDPPYAIDVEMMQQSTSGIKGIDRIFDTHQVEDNMALFKAMMPLFYKVLKPTGYCILWADQMLWQYLFDLGESVGFKVQRWPHVWCKTSQCKNQMAFVNETKATEIAIVMRKADAKLAQTVVKNFTCAEGLSEKLSNPFAKPAAVWLPLIEMVSTPGQTVLDPFAGEGTCPMACLNANRKVIAIELESSHYAYMVEEFKQFHIAKHGKVQFI